MKIDLTDVSPVKKTMLIEVEPAEVAKATAEVLADYRRKARIPGFRVGKAPLDVVRKRYAKEVAEDVQERVLSKSYAEAAKEKGLQPLGDPVLEEVEHEEGQGLKFKTSFEVLPQIEPKGYENLSVRRPAAEVTDEEVAQALEQVRQARTTLHSAEGAAAATGDVIVADLEATPEGGEAFTREGMMIEVGAPDNLPAFNEKLEGGSAGSTLEFPVDYPEEHPEKALAGRTVAYKLAVTDVKRRVVPELDDEFAKDIGDFENLEAFRARVREDLAHRKKHEVEHTMRQSLLDKVLLENTVVLPDALVEREVRFRLEEIVRNMMARGMDPEKAEVDWKQLRDQQLEPARKSVHARLVLDAIARVESIEVAREEVEERLQREAQRAGEDYKEVHKRMKKQGGLEALRNQLVREKSLDYLTSIANIDGGE